jgi:hypothetical protein
MAKICATIDTQTQDCMLAMDGMPMSVDSLNMGKMPMTGPDGNMISMAYISFSQQMMNDKTGMMERHTYSWDSSIDSTSSDANSVVEIAGIKMLVDIELPEDKNKADIAKFFTGYKKNRNL